MTEAPRPVLELKDLSRSFSGPHGQTAVLDGINLSLEAGESVAIMGASGSGKSTLLQIMGALDSPSAGQVLFQGQDLSSLDDDALARHRNRHVGFVFQQHHLLQHCTALENVLVPTLVYKGEAPSVAFTERARDYLEVVGLKDRMDHRPAQLSGGERQRVAVVRALINGPRLVLADEPTGALDSENSSQVLDQLLALNERQGATLVLVTHSKDVAARLTKQWLLKDGRLDQDASAS